MPDNQAGVAAAVASTSRQVGQALGVAVTGSILGAAVGAHIGARLTSASHPAWWLIVRLRRERAGVGRRLRRAAGARRTAERCAEQLEREAAASRPLQPA